jgi:hypothetical protein
VIFAQAMAVAGPATEAVGRVTINTRLSWFRWSRGRVIIEA